LQGGGIKNKGALGHEIAQPSIKAIGARLGEVKIKMQKQDWGGKKRVESGDKEVTATGEKPCQAR